MTTNLPLQKNGTAHADSASRLWLLLLCTDAAFILLHIIYFQTELLNNSLYSLSRDNGYAEFFQYVKFLWIVLLLIGIVKSTRTAGYLAWTLLFIYFLTDDAFQLHENLGRNIARNLDFVPPMSIRLQDVGELIVTAVAGAILIPLLILAFWCGSMLFRKVSVDLVMFLAVLVFVGVVVDLVHEAVGAEGMLDHLVFRIIEEGGEMIVASAILWYIFLLSMKNGNIGWYLHERLRTTLLGLAKIP
ncbi:MAG: hypothetical protein L6Q26_02655 [Anaerolineales bacterium]|nr:hypothetical protein [Anaerolineales bacterium]NUQ83528.1 hypothetical protein [Anaerolineales bacterium]